MATENNQKSRRRFIAWGVAAAAVVSAVKFVLPARKFMLPGSKGKETVKMLTQEGKLVEIDITALPSKKKKISNKELQNWVRK